MNQRRNALTTNPTPRLNKHLKDGIKIEDLAKRCDLTKPDLQKQLNQQFIELKTLLGDHVINYLKSHEKSTSERHKAKKNVMSRQIVFSRTGNHSK